MTKKQKAKFRIGAGLKYPNAKEVVPKEDFEAVLKEGAELKGRLDDANKAYDKLKEENKILNLKLACNNYSLTMNIPKEKVREFKGKFHEMLFEACCMGIQYGQERSTLAEVDNHRDKCIERYQKELLGESEK